MPSTTFYLDGQWNFYCDLCGRKEKSTQAEKTWDGMRVCKRHVELRNPQDYIRGPAPTPPLPWTRAHQPDNFPWAWDLLQEDGCALLQEDFTHLLTAALPSAASLL